MGFQPLYIFNGVGDRFSTSDSGVKSRLLCWLVTQTSMLYRMIGGVNYLIIVVLHFFIIFHSFEAGIADAISSFK